MVLGHANNEHMLVPATLAADIESAFNEAFSDKENPDASRKKLAQKLATAIDKYIKTAQVNPGIAVATAGSPTAQTGATTAPGTLS